MNIAINAQLIIDTIIFEKTSTRELSAPDLWKSRFSCDVSKHILESISGLSIGNESGEFEWEKAENALRASGLFRSIRIETDTIGSRRVAIYIVHQSALPNNGPGLNMNIGGKGSSLGSIYETNTLYGENIDVLANIINRTENGIGPEISLKSAWNYAFDSRLTIGLDMHYHQFTQGFKAIAAMQAHPMGGLYYGIEAVTSKGKDFVYDMANTLKINQNSKEFSCWAGWLLPRKDNLYFTIRASTNKTERELPRTVQAFDNTSSLLFGFGSLADRTRTVNGEDIHIGAWGSAVLGRIMPSSSRGVESYYYVGGTVEQSELTSNDKLYAYARLSAGSGLIRGGALNTALEAIVRSSLAFQNDLIIAANMQALTSWNWGDFRQLVLDNDAGVRGLPINGIVGKNRMTATLEMRKDILPLFWGTRLGLTAFVDAGTVWNSGESLFKTEWKSSIGGGILLLAEGRSFQTGNPLLRLEYAYGLQKGGGIVIATQYAFSLFTSHRFEQPSVIGSRIDIE